MACKYGNLHEIKGLLRLLWNCISICHKPILFRAVRTTLLDLQKLSEKWMHKDHYLWHAARYQAWVWDDIQNWCAPQGYKNVAVAKAHIGGGMTNLPGESDKTFMKMSSTALRLDIILIDAPGSIMNEESPEVLMKAKHLCLFGMADTFAKVDFPVFKNIISSHFLCRISIFLG